MKQTQSERIVQELTRHFDLAFIEQYQALLFPLGKKWRTQLHRQQKKQAKRVWDRRSVLQEDREKIGKRFVQIMHHFHLAVRSLERARSSLLNMEYYITKSQRVGLC